MKYIMRDQRRLLDLANEHKTVSTLVTGSLLPLLQVFAFVLATTSLFTVLLLIT